MRTPAIQRKCFVRFYDNHPGRDLRDWRGAIRARSCGYPHIQIVHVFSADLVGGNCAQIIKFFNQTYWVESLHSGWKIVIQMIPAPWSVRFISAPAIAAERAEVSPHAIRSA